MFRKKCIKKASIFYEQSKEWTKTTQSLKQPIYEKEALNPYNSLLSAGKKWSSLFSFWLSSKLLPDIYITEISWKIN